MTALLFVVLLTANVLAQVPSVVTGPPVQTQTQTQTQPTVRTPPPAPSPDPVQTMIRAFNDVDFQTAFLSLAVKTTDGLATNGLNGAFDDLRTAWGLPGAWFHRDLDCPNGGSDPQCRALQLNAQLLAGMGGYVLLALVVGAVGNIIAIRRGANPSMAGLITVWSQIILAIVLAASSIDVLKVPAMIADFIFDTIGAATLQDFGGPALCIVPTAIPFGGILLAAIWLIVLGFLTFVIYKELAWCVTLLSESAPWLFAWLLPWSVPKALGGGLGMKFIGTCFAPAVALAALRIAAPTFADFDACTDIKSQLGRIIYAAVAYEAPAVIAYAISVHTPAVGDAYMAGRAMGLFRPTPHTTGLGGGVGGVGAAAVGAAAAASAPRASSPGHAGSATGKTVFRGGRKYP